MPALAADRVTRMFLAAVLILIQIRLPFVVIAEKIILHDIQAAQQQYHEEQLQQLQRSSSVPLTSSSSSIPTTQLLSATLKTQLFHVSTTIQPYQRTLLARALHNFFEHVFDDARQDVYKLDITHVAVYEEKLFMKATTSHSDRKLVLNSLQASQFHMNDGGDGDDDDDDDAGDDDDDDAGNAEIDTGDGSREDDNKYSDDEGRVNKDATITKTLDSDSIPYVLSFATFISAKDSTYPQSSLSQEGEFETMLIHVCHKFNSHLVEFVNSIDDDYFHQITNALVSGFEEDELREEVIENEAMTHLSSELSTTSSISRFGTKSIVAMLLGSVGLIAGIIKMRRRAQQRNLNRWRCHEISTSNTTDASSSIKSLQILYNKPTALDYYDDDYSFDPLGSNNAYYNDNIHITKPGETTNSHVIQFNSRKEQYISKMNIALEEEQYVYAPPGKVGVAIDVIDGNPVVHKIKRGSPLEGLLLPKDLIIAIDEVDTTCMSAADVTQLMVKRMKYDRKITFVRRM